MPDIGSLSYTPNFGKVPAERAPDIVGASRETTRFPRRVPQPLLALRSSLGKGG